MAFILARTAASRTLRYALPQALNRVGLPFDQLRTISVTPICRAKKFTKSHEWVDIANDGKSCTIGISKYAADALGDVVYVELPAPGDEVTAGEAFGTVESVKSASDVLSPASGIVTSTNESLESTPADLSQDPEDSSWLIKLAMEDGVVAEGLMEKAAYEEYLGTI